MRSLPIAASGLVALVTIQKATQTIRFTTADHPLIVDGNLYPTAPGADLTGLQYPSDGTPSNADVTIITEAGGIIEPGDGARGVLDNWPIEIDLVDPNDLSAAYSVLTGTIGSVDEDTNGLATIAANGPARLMQQDPLTEHYALTGREDLGDNRCKVPLCVDVDIAAFDIGRNQDFVTPAIATGLLNVSDAYGRVRTGVADDPSDYANVYFECITDGTTASSAPTYDPTIDAVTDDGSAQFVARDAWTRYATGEAVNPFIIQLDDLPDARATDASWYLLGGIFVRSGNLNGFPKMPIRGWNPSTLRVQLFLPVAITDIPAGTKFEIHVGCDLTRDMCFARFDNISNLRAETFTPPPELQFGL